MVEVQARHYSTSDGGRGGGDRKTCMGFIILMQEKTGFRRGLYIAVGREGVECS